MFDDGVLEIYRRVKSKSAMGGAVEVLEHYADAWYGELSFSISEYYTARQAQSSIEKRVRLHQDRGLCNKHVVLVDGTQYQVGRVFNGVEDGIPITDLTLERLVKQYDIT